MRKNNLDRERHIRFLIDSCIILLGACALGVVFDQYYWHNAISHVHILYNCLFYLVCMMGFLYVFEEYTHILISRQEKKVTFILSGIYTGIIWIAAGLIVYRDTQMLLFQLVTVAVTVILLEFYNLMIRDWLRKGTKKEKPRLLVLESTTDDTSRLRRIKYGAQLGFDSWYEQIDTNDLSIIQQYINVKFKEYDAICILDNVSDDAYRLFCDAAYQMGKELYIVPKLSTVNYKTSKLVRFDDILTFHMRSDNMSTVNRALKRTFDLIFVLVALIFAAIPMGIVAIAIKATSPGPVLYKQVRLTKNKREFEIYKFRTMVQDAEKLSGPVFAVKEDPRITKVGRVLRAMRLDELPQLFNILKGEMSVVGPRPERPFFVEQFEKEFDNYDLRFAVKAGLTSLSHIYGKYSTHIQDRTCYDLLYVSNYSIFLDIKIILLTSRTMFIKDMAEGEDTTLYDTKTGVSA